MSAGPKLSMMHYPLFQPILTEPYQQYEYKQPTTSPSLSISSSSSSSSFEMPSLQPINKKSSVAWMPALVANSQPTSQPAQTWNFTWLVFMNAKWVPFDTINQTRLEQTLTVGGTFVDIQDSHFPNVKRVRVFPKNNYLSYLGVKYRLSRIMQPDAYLDHVGVAEAKKNPLLYRR
ncbi:hypothetical protein EDC96DRAFT_508582 [Choanephora cucurbitarum]|nr:hypothetical protein EDC96DRAFT_508582 [Choanephora cucurbitarum]